MSTRRIEVGRVTIRMRGGAWPKERAGRVARLAFQHLQQLAAGDAHRGGARGLVAPEPIRVRAGASDNDMARAVGDAVHAAIRKG